MAYARTLILNQLYRPHDIVDWKEAVTSMFTGKIEVLSEYDEVMAVIGRRTLDSFPELKRALRRVVGTNAESITIKVPAVAVLKKPVDLVKAGTKFSRVNVYTRDDYRCCYCGARFPISKLTYDHVHPKSRGGKTWWNNVVTACKNCNSTKADRTPEEAGMRLLRKPNTPATLPITGPIVDLDTIPVEWKDFYAHQLSN